MKESPAARGATGLYCGQLLLADAGYSAMKSRVTDESTLTPGKMVEDGAMLFT